MKNIFSNDTVIKIFFASMIFWGVKEKAVAQQVIPLYRDSIPNSIPTADAERGKADETINVSHPTLTIFRAAGKGQSPAVIICPGGGYGSLVMNREGYRIARALNENGVTACVLKYRLPSNKIMQDPSIGPLQDAQQAMKLLRSKAALYHIDPGRIGIMGFSAGGHLAATAGTHFLQMLITNKDSINLRPDFLILVYPVISFRDSLAHQGSVHNLLGASPSRQQLDSFSNELQVTAATPPSFLVHAADDVWVPPGNSIRFFEALIKNNVPAELHIYAKGSHGFLYYPPLKEWMGRCMNWMKILGIVHK